MARLGADMRGHYPDALLRIVDDFTIAAVNLDPAGIALREGGELRRIVQIVDLHLYARKRFTRKGMQGTPHFGQQRRQDVFARSGNAAGR